MDLLDVATAEQAEQQIDAFIRARSRSQEEANRVEEAWAESTRRFNLHRHRGHAKAWLEYHDRQLAALEATFDALIARHRAERDRYARILGIAHQDHGPPGEAA